MIPKTEVSPAQSDSQVTILPGYRGGMLSPKSITPNMTESISIDSKKAIFRTVLLSDEGAFKSNHIGTASLASGAPVTISDSGNTKPG